MGEVKELRTRIGALSREQKTMLALLAFFAICVVGLGIFQIRTTMYAPFALSNDIPTNIKDSVSGIDTLRYRDTDRDGLSDFEELYVYGTSPYLLDTFGYGVSDKEVIARGLPLCPKGQDCSNLATGASGLPVQNVSSTFGDAASVIGEPPPDIKQSLSDPTQLRQMLLQAGVKPEVLSNVSDNELILMVQQMIQGSSSTLGNFSNP